MRITRSVALAALVACPSLIAGRPLRAQSNTQQLDRAEPSPHIVVVRATEYRLDAQPGVAAGTLQLRFENAGREVHHLWLVRLEQGRTFNDFLRIMDSPNPPALPSWAVDVGGLNDLSPGMSATAILTLEPGDYAMADLAPSPDGRPHVTRGMFKELTVTTPDETGEPRAAEPAADVTLQMTDYAFELSKPIESGETVVRVENVGQQSHEVLIGQLRSDKSMSDALDWFQQGMHGSAPVLAIGGVSGLAKGRHEVIALDFAPGRYVLFCFVPDAKDGKPHTAHGMMKEFSVGPVAASQ